MTRTISEELTVVCYDIAHDRRRYRVVRILEGYGVRVQESVFECWLLPAQRRRIQAQLDLVIDQLEDRVAFYRLSGEDVRAVILIGSDTCLSNNPGIYCS